MALITSTQVKEFLQVTNDSHDTLLDSIITRVEEIVKNEWLNGTTFDASGAYNTETDYYDGDNTRILYVDKLPLRSVTSVHIDPERVYGDDTLVSSDDYSVYESEGKIVFDAHTLTAYPKAVKVVYTAGWQDTDAPERLKQGIIYLVCAFYLEGVGIMDAVENQDFENRPDRLRKRAKEQLMYYKTNKVM